MRIVGLFIGDWVAEIWDGHPERRRRSPRLSHTLRVREGVRVLFEFGFSSSSGSLRDRRGAGLARGCRVRVILCVDLSGELSRPICSPARPMVVPRWCLFIK